MSTDDTDDQHFPRRWGKLGVSLGDIFSLALSLTALGVTYGKISTDVQHANETIESILMTIRELQGQDISPGARAQLEAVRAQDAAMQAQINDLRIELRESRKELLDEMRTISGKLDKHSERNR